MKFISLYAGLLTVLAVQISLFPSDVSAQAKAKPKAAPKYDSSVPISERSQRQSQDAN